MNLAFWTRFSRNRKSNAVLTMLEHLRKHPVFKKARFDLYTPTTEPRHLIVLLGQIHTVWKGKISNRDRKKIVRCQARLCSYYAYFEQFHNIKNFGGEGIYEGLETEHFQRACHKLYKELETKLEVEHPVRLEQLATVARSVLKELGEVWHQELRKQNDLQKLQLYASAVSGQTLFSYLNDGEVTMTPIEGEQAYQKVLEGVTKLGDRIRKIEAKPEFRFVKQRGGKVKNEKEAQVIVQYNALVKEFNSVIGSDLREQATLSILKEKASEKSLVVFTMGIGHRKNYRRLVDDFLKDTQTAFLFITPPELLINWWIAIGLPLLVLLGFFLLNSYLGA